MPGLISTSDVKAKRSRGGARPGAGRKKNPPMEHREKIVEEIRAEIKSASPSGPQPEDTGFDFGSFESNENQSQQQNQTQTPPTPPAFDIPDAVLKPVVQFPFTFMRNRTGFEGFGMDAQTENQSVELLKIVINQYMPNVDSKHLPAIMLSWTICSTLYMQNEEYKKSKKGTPPTSPAGNQKTPDEFKVGGLEIVDTFNAL